MATYDDLAEKQEELVRKPLDGSAFFAPLSADGIDETFVGAGGVLAALPTEYGDLGLLTPDGMGFSREVSNSDIMAFGRQTPVRSDITNDTTTLNVVALETNLQTIGMATGASITAGSRNATSGALMIRKPPRPTPRQYRVFCLAVDNTDDGEIYIGRFLPRAKVTGFSDQALGGTDNAIEWGTTLTSQFDKELGFSEAWLFGGPGWNALVDEMGFDAIPA